MKFSGKNFQPWPAFELDIQGLTILIGPSNEGKCLAKGTPVFMYDGTIKNVEDVQVSDLLMGPDSKPRRVLSLAHGWDEMYDIIPKKGDRWRCNSRHILPLKFNGKKLQGKCPSYRHPIEIEVRDLVCRGKWFRNSARLQRSSAITFPCNREVFNPYFVGLWLGDGSTNLHSLAITTADQEVLDYLNKVADKFNLRLRRNGKKGNKASTWVFSGGRKWVAPKRGHSQNALLSKFRSLGLVVDGEKRLSWEYKTASSRDRMLLLAGLLDSDGHLEGQKQFEFVSKLKALADDAAFIARSLGFRASVKPSKKEDQNGRGGVYFRVRIAGELTSIPTRIQRKQAKHDSSKNPLTTGFHATSAGWGEYFGFELDGDGLFLLGDFTIAHNSSLYRALQGIIRNELDVAYIRDPKDEPLELTLEHDGHTVVATRSKRGSVAYTIGEDKFSKLDGDIPEIVKKFNLGEIKIGDFTFDPIFASQNRPQFLIDNKTYKPSEINAILGAFGGTEKLEAGKKQANLLKTQKDGEARVLAAQIRNSEEPRRSWRRCPRKPTSWPKSYRLWSPPPATWKSSPIGWWSVRPVACGWSPCNVS